MRPRALERQDFLSMPFGMRAAKMRSGDRGQLTFFVRCLFRNLGERRFQPALWLLSKISPIARDSFGHDYGHGHGH
jgi:hypothetical protein